MGNVHQHKGPPLEQMTTQQLYAEVRVNAATSKPVETSLSSSNEARALTTTEFQQAIQALNTRIDDFQRKNDHACGNWRGQRGGRGGGGGSLGDFNRKGRGKGQGGNKRFRQPYDPEKYCDRHKNRGHSTEECILLKREAHEAAASNQHANTSNYQANYRSNFNRPQYSATVTRLIVNNTEIQRSDPQDWIVDSAANAYSHRSTKIYTIIASIQIKY